MSEDQQEKRGPGRPRRGEGTEHIDLTLSRNVLVYLRSLPSGERSRFVDKAIQKEIEREKGHTNDQTRNYL